MKYYNYDLAKKIISKFEDLGMLVQATLGMHEDWFWTAETIWEDGKYTRDLCTTKHLLEVDKRALVYRKNGGSIFNEQYDEFSKHYINGLPCSDWGTPVLEIETLDNDKIIFNCYHQKEDKRTAEQILKDVKRAIDFTDGVLSKPIRELRDSFEVIDFKDDK